MAQGQQGDSVAPDTLPTDFFDQKNASTAPDTLPGDFFEGSKSTTTIGPHQGGIPNLSDANGPLGKYLQQSENLTQEGIKDHPVQNFIGQTVKRGKEFAGIIGTMGALALAPEDAALARVPVWKGMTDAPKVAPPDTMAPEIPTPSWVTRNAGKVAPPERAPVWKGSALGEIQPTSPMEPTPAPSETHVWHPNSPKVLGDIKGNPTPFEQPKGYTTPLKDVINPSVEKPSMLGPKTEATTSLETKYPDKALRAMVHANGERVVDTIGNNPELMNGVHKLTAQDIREAWINSGEKNVQPGTWSGNRYRWSGTGQGRIEDLNHLLDKGLSPKEILELAKK